MEKCRDFGTRQVFASGAIKTLESECREAAPLNAENVAPEAIERCKTTQSNNSLPDVKTANRARDYVLKIRPVSHGKWVDYAELWGYRDLLWSLAARDLKLRYRQTALGILWVIFQPLAGAGIFAIVFGWVAGLASDKASYFLFSLAGLLVWNAFQSTLGKASTALIGNAALVSKVYFPRLLLPLSTVLSSLVDFTIGLSVFVVFALLSDAKCGWPNLFILSLWLACALASAVGLGLLASAVMTRFRDVQHILPVLLPFLMYGSPVAYALDAVPNQWKSVFLWNPMSWVLEGSRAALLGTPPVSTFWTIYAVGGAVCILIVGLLGFRKMERTFADVL
ncbi:MAG: ABC transporter permease [Verrucomicrobiota bacterium]